MLDNAPPRAGDVRALAHQLLSWADHLSDRHDPARELTEEGRHELILCLATALREAYRLRTTIFPEARFGSPDWDVMLDLFIQEMNGFRTSLDQLALTGHLPATVVFEAVNVLAGIGLLERTQDRFDERVIWLSLTVKGRQGVFDLFAQSAEFIRPIIGRAPDGEDAEASA